MSISERLRQRIAALRVDYVATFQEELAGLDAAWAHYEATGSAALLIERGHRLAGTAGSYALHEVYRCAQALEALGPKGERALLMEATDALRGALQNARATDPG